jgi:ADP-ribosylglycohydrolase
MFEFPMTTDRRKAVIDRLGKYLAPTESGISISNVYPLLRAELGQFVAQETASGNVRYAADVGCHDDLVMSLAISLWVLIEEAGDSSPLAATNEEVGWRPTNRLDMRSIREARQKAIDDMEESYRSQWESFSINSAMRGWNG